MLAQQVDLNFIMVRIYCNIEKLCYVTVIDCCNNLTFRI